LGDGLAVVFETLAAEALLASGLGAGVWADAGAAGVLAAVLEVLELTGFIKVFHQIKVKQKQDSNACKSTH
jgi:hypothetical protein